MIQLVKRSRGVYCRWHDRRIMERVARQRPGTEPRSVLGAPLILANKDLQGGHLVTQIFKRQGNLQVC